LLQARLVWSFFTKSTQCLKLCGDSMIWLVQLSYQYQKNLANYTVLIQTLNRLFFPFVYLLHVHIACTSCLICSQKQQMTFLQSTLQCYQLPIFKSTPLENYEIVIYQATFSVSSTTTGFMWLCIATISAGTASFMTHLITLDSSS